MSEQQQKVIEVVRDVHMHLSLSQIADVLKCGASTVRGVLKGKEQSVIAANITSGKIEELVVRAKYSDPKGR